MKSAWSGCFTGTWNPIDGCLYGCPYCNAAHLAKHWSDHRSLAYYMAQEQLEKHGAIHVLNEPLFDEVDKSVEPFPFGFSPTFCRYRLDQPLLEKTPQRYLICSMGELWGDWIPQDWIEEVMEAARRAPWHRYFFLSRNPSRYGTVGGRTSNMFFGATITRDSDFLTLQGSECNAVNYLLIEPMQEQVSLRDFLQVYTGSIGWVVIGPDCMAHAEIPKLEWVLSIQKACAAFGIPLYMKEGNKNPDGSYPMSSIMGTAFRQELPDWFQAG